jgi:hypothetical protein
VQAGVGVGDVEAAGHEWLERDPQTGDAGERERAECRAVVRDLAGDRLCALGLAGGAEVLAGELPRRLDRFRAASGEEHAVEVAGCKLRDALRELNRRRVRVAPDREVAKLLRLGARRFGEFLAAVADLHREQSREPVEVTLSRVVPHVAALAACDDRNVGVLVRAESGEVHPEVLARRGL